MFFWVNYVDCGYRLGNLPMTMGFVFLFGGLVSGFKILLKEWLQASWGW